MYNCNKSSLTFNQWYWQNKIKKYCLILKQTQLYQGIWSYEHIEMNSDG